MQLALRGRRWFAAPSIVCGWRKETRKMAEQAELTRPHASATKLQTVNPANGEPGKSYDRHTIEDGHHAAETARAVFLSWRRTSFADRSAIIRKAAEVLRSRKDEFARLMTEEMGKTLDDGRAEVEKCAFHCDWFADNADKYLEKQPVEIGGGGEAFVTFNPLGVILAVMPWNFPFWQVFRAAAPALMAGNGMLLKHASNVPGCALAIEGVLHQAGVPKGLFRTLQLQSSDVEPLIKDENVAAVTLTGSVPAGRAVATAAGSVLKKCVLELGGSDAYIVLEDADVAAAAKVAATARMVNGGQSCIAGKRFVVVRSILDAFEKALVEAMRAYDMGDPTQEGTKLGPMVSIKARDEIHKQVEESIAKGAKLLLGGTVPDRPGAWYPATVLANVRPGQPANDEEVFGPVAAIIVAEDEVDAIRIANSSEFGLGSGVLTSDLERGRRIAAEELEAGMSFVNESVRSDPRAPFGGVKHSGYGRECSAFGIHEFVNIKTVHVKPLGHGGQNGIE
jgi:succinate-semialdehyde dehydrogenase/glutarate-semialdehyde dehydrogenase